MITKAAEKVTDRFIQNRLVDEKQKEVYTYGMELLISTLLSTGMVLGIGAVCHRLWYTVVLMIPFYHIRIYAGGFHAENYVKCFSAFVGGYCMIMTAAEYLIRSGKQDLIVAASVLSFALIWKWSPVEDHSRPLDMEERKAYGTKARKTAAFYTVAAVLIYTAFRPAEAVYMASSINAVLLMLLTGIIKNRLTGFDPVRV